MQNMSTNDYIKALRKEYKVTELLPEKEFNRFGTPLLIPIETICLVFSNKSYSLEHKKYHSTPLEITGYLPPVIFRTMSTTYYRFEDYFLDTRVPTEEELTMFELETGLSKYIVLLFINSKMFTGISEKVLVLAGNL